MRWAFSSGETRIDTLRFAWENRRLQHQQQQARAEGRRPSTDGFVPITFQPQLFIPQMHLPIGPGAIDGLGRDAFEHYMNRQASAGPPASGEVFSSSSLDLPPSRPAHQQHSLHYEGTSSGPSFDHRYLPPLQTNPRIEPSHFNPPSAVVSASSALSSSISSLPHSGSSISPDVGDMSASVPFDLPLGYRSGPEHARFPGSHIPSPQSASHSASLYAFPHTHDDNSQRMPQFEDYHHPSLSYHHHHPQETNSHYHHAHPEPILLHHHASGMGDGQLPPELFHDTQNVNPTRYPPAYDL